MASDAVRIEARHTHAVVFIGPPFGPADGGRVVSLHTSEHAADVTFDGLAEAGVVHDKIVVALDQPYWRDPEGRTAREHFSG